MSRFAPLLDDGPSRARLSVPQDDRSEFLRRAPIIPAEETVATLDRGGNNLDLDLGRALNSTPRLATNAGNKYLPVDEAEAKEFGFRPSILNDEYIDGVKTNARKAILAGRATGEKADEFRSKFADIRKRHWGGFLNYKNWGWVRNRRERSLRSQIQSQFPVNSHRGAAADHAPAPDQPAAPQLQAPAQVDAAPAAQQAVAARSPFDVEAEASAPFSAGGAYRGQADVTARGDGQVRAIGKAVSAGSSALTTGNLLFGVQSAQPAATPEMTSALKKYASAMKKSMAAEKLDRHQAAAKTRQDQGELSMAQLPDEFRQFRTALYNGYWGAEAANPAPTRKAGHDRRVRFADGSDPLPAEERDPNRPFALKQKGAAASKEARKAAIAEQMNALKSQQSTNWNEVEAAGARWHQEEPQLQAAVRAQALAAEQTKARSLASASQSPVVEQDEEKVAPANSDTSMTDAALETIPPETDEGKASVAATPVDPRIRKAAKYFRSGFNPERHLLPGEKAARRHDLGPGAREARFPAHEDPRVKPTPEYTARIARQLAKQRPAPTEMIQAQAPRVAAPQAQAAPDVGGLFDVPEAMPMSALQDSTGSGDNVRLVMERIARYRS